MEGARVVVVDTHPYLVENHYPQFLEREGHNLVASATSLEDTFVMVGQLRCRGETVDVGLIDLDSGPNNPADSIEAARMIKEELGADVHIISTSSAGQFEGADAHFDIMELEAIRKHIRKLKRVRP